MPENARANRLFLESAILFVLATLVVNGISDLVIGWIKGTLLPNVPPLLVVFTLSLLLLIAFFFLSRALARRAGKIFGADVRAYSAKQQIELPFILMGYSPDGHKKSQEAMKELDKLGPEIVAKPSEEYTKYITDNNLGPNVSSLWQQNLRSAWHHRKKLKAIYVLEPSESHFGLFQAYLENAFAHSGNQVEVIRIADAGDSERPFRLPDYNIGGDQKPDYENYLYVYEGLRRGLEMIRQRPDAAEFAGYAKLTFWQRIFSSGSIDDELDLMTCVDATAGNKIYSIAAAAITLNRPLKFSYVTSGPTGGRVKFYDTALRLAGSGA